MSVNMRGELRDVHIDRKSTRLNSSHVTTRRYTLFPYTTLFRSYKDRWSIELFFDVATQCTSAYVSEYEGRAARRSYRSEEHTSELQSRNDTSLHTLSLHDALPILQGPLVD